MPFGKFIQGLAGNFSEQNKETLIKEYGQYLLENEEIQSGYKLIRAYAGSVALAVKEIGIIEIKEQAGIAIQMSYSQYQEYSNFLKEHNLIELDTNFTDQVDTMIYVDKEEKETIKAALVEFFNGKVTLTDQGLREVEVPVNLV